MKIKERIIIFLTFAKIGLFTFGGGYAMIPILQREITENKKWIEEEELMHIIAISQMTPGPIAINVATFTGYKKGKTRGAIWATLGVVLPSLILIIILAKVLNAVYEYHLVLSAFKGIRIGVSVLIAEAAFTMMKKYQQNFYTVFLLVAAFVGSFVFDINAVLIVLGTAAIGILYSLTNLKRKDI